MSSSPPYRLRLLLGVTLALLTFALFSPALRHAFLNYDDDRYVTKNPLVKLGLTGHGLKLAFTRSYSSNWHPLTWVSHMLDYGFFGENPAGHHLTSLLFHTANVVLLFVLLQKVTGRIWRSLLVAILFGWHPLRLESVAWIAERKDVLSTFFALLSLGAYVRYCRFAKSLKATHAGQPTAISDGNQPPTHPEARRAKGWYALALMFFAAGLMSKPMVVTLPLIMLLLDFWPLQRFHVHNSLGEKLPFFALSVFSCVITFLAQANTGAVASLARLPMAARLTNALVAYVQYLRKMILPNDLAVFYPHPGVWPAVTIIFAAVFLAACTVAVLRQMRRHPYLLTGWFWFLGTLVPVLGLVQVGEQALADRYTYLPSIGLLIALVWGTAELSNRWSFGRYAGAAFGILCVITCALSTSAQLPYWQNSETLFTRALAVTKNNFVAHNNLGNALFDAGKYESARAHFAEAVKIKPDYFEARYNLGNACGKLRRPKEGIEHYRAALTLSPGDPGAHLNLGNLLQETGRPDEAAEHYEAALRRRPNEPEYHFNYGTLLGRQGRTDDAIAHLAQALRLKPGFAEAHYELAKLFALSSRPEDALAHYRRALEFKNDFVDAEIGLGSMLESLGRRDEAHAHYRTALRLKPDSAHAHSNLGISLAQEGRSAEAAEHFEAVVRLEPKNADARYNLGNALMAQKKFRAAAEQYSELLLLNPNDVKARSKLDLCRRSE